MTQNAQRLLSLDNSPISALWHMDKPMIAAVNGAAAGFGMDMALLADIRILSDTAKLAEECLSLGLANAVVSPETVLPTALQWAEEIAANAPLAVQTTKRMMRLGMEESFPTTVDHLMMHFKALTATEDFQEALAAFNEKRPPVFKGC